MELINSVNYFAVLLCGLISMGIGAFWYSNMFFGKMWMASLDKSEEELKKDFQPIKTYLVSFVAQLVMAYILARIMIYVGAETPIDGIRIAFMAWIGFIGTTMTINFLFEGRTFQQFLVDSGYHFIVLLLYGFILGLWR